VLEPRDKLEARCAGAPGSTEGRAHTRHTQGVCARLLDQAQGARQDWAPRERLDWVPVSAQGLVAGSAPGLGVGSAAVGT
jgi:hypothetical protein